MKIASVRLTHSNAGPSPLNDNRVEIFFAGCKKAREGNPCKGCFNQDLWHDTTFKDIDIKDIIKDVKSYNNPYVTIVGGEPFDQYKDLFDLCKILKKNNFHIIVFTHYTLDEIREYSWSTKTRTFKEFIQNCDIIIDGEYVEKEKIYNESIKDAFHNVIGSGNQTVWQKNNGSLLGFEAKEIDNWFIDKENKMHIVSKNFSGVPSNKIHYIKNL